MVGINRHMNRFIRKTLYSLKRQYGSLIYLYKLNDASTNYETGVKISSQTRIVIKKCVVLPVKIQREVVQSVIGKNRAFAYGGSYDAGSRSFIVDARDLPTDYTIENDDWIVYNNHRYNIQAITEFEQHTGWILLGKEILGVVPEQIVNLSVTSSIDLTDSGSGL
jgi:hypothetical protein